MMGIGISACAQKPGQGTSTSGSRTTENDNNALSEGVQAYSGNKIGHNPLLPKKFIAPVEHSRPSSIFELVQWFNGSIMESNLYKMLYYHMKNGRLIRSEFREMVSMGCAILTHYYDVITGEIGFKDEKGRWVRLSYQQFATKLNVSLVRVKRFFKFLKERNLVTIVQDKQKNENQKWKSNVARKYLKPAFFIQTLGIKAWKKVERLRNWLISKAKPKTKDQAENVSILKGLFKGAANPFKNVLKRIPATSPLKPNDSTKERKLISMARELFANDPSTSLADYMRKIKSHYS